MEKFFETENELIETVDIVSAIIDAVREKEETAKITILTGKIFHLECKHGGVPEAVRWLEFRNKLRPIMLAKVEFLDSEEKPLYFIRPKKECVEKITKQCCNACEKCMVQKIQKISEKQLWAVLNQKHSGVMHIVTRNGSKMCTNAGLPPSKLLEVLQKNKARFFCFEKKEAYQITK